LFNFTAPPTPVLARTHPTSIGVCQLSSSGQITSTITSTASDIANITRALSALPEWHGEAINCPDIPLHPAMSGFLLRYAGRAQVFVRFGPSCDSVASRDGTRQSRGLPARVEEYLTFAHG
jgi:hypothetical protein